MVDFLRTRVAPWIAWFAAMGAAAWLWRDMDPGAARGFVESASYTVAAPLATMPYVANTVVFNVSGHPALSVPAGVDRHGIPIPSSSRAAGRHLGFPACLGADPAGAHS